MIKETPVLTVDMSLTSFGSITIKAILDVYQSVGDACVSGSMDPYKILGIDPNATYEEVRQAYRRAATKYHPDAGGDAWVFQQVQQAFAMLRKKFENADSQARDSTPKADPQPQQRTSTNGTATDANYDNRGSVGETIQRWLPGGSLELRDETSYFILANFLDLVMTGILLRVSAVEANPIAAFVHHHFGFVGMVGLKVASVVLVCALAQVIAKHKRATARALLICGTIVVAAVVVYSMFLARNEIHFR